MSLENQPLGVEDLAGLDGEPEEPMPRAPRLRFLTPGELRGLTPAEPDWLWRGYLAAGTVTLISGKPKAGKSTIAIGVATAIAIGARQFLGQAVERSPVVYVSEEGASTLRHKLPGDDVELYLLTRDAAWPKPDWAELVRAAAQHAERVGARILFFDTAAYWAGLPAEREKDAGAVQAVMEPLAEAASSGRAIVLVLHARKSGGEDGDAVRGSSAWAGSADTILELERPDGEQANPHHRLLLGLGRYPQTPGAVLVDHDPNTGGWAVVGHATNRRDARESSLRATILGALPQGEPGLARGEIEEATGLDWRKLNPQLNALLHQGEITRAGAGQRGDPYRYHKAVPPVPGTETDSGDRNEGVLLLSSRREGTATTTPFCDSGDSNGWHEATDEEEARILSLVADYGEQGT